MPLGDIQAAELKIKANIRRLGLNGTPAQQILLRPGHEAWLAATTPLQLAVRICQNTHWYGQNGPTVWSWTAGSGTNNTGEALARGTTPATNCGGFNMTARWIGTEVAGLSDDEFKGSYTDANDFFITAPNTIAIDRNWQGSVRTVTTDFAGVGAFFFKGHSFSKYGGTMLDASTNIMNFQSKFDLYWCSLNLATDRPGRVFLVSQRFNATLIPGVWPYCCVSHVSLLAFRHLFPIVVTGAPGQGRVTQHFISGMSPTSGAGWPTFLLASCADLPAAFRTANRLP